jgi:hypothetical protein
LSDLAETWWDAPNTDSFTAGCQTGRGIIRSLYTPPPMGVFSSCLLRVWLFAVGRVISSAKRDF